MWQCWIKSWVFLKQCGRILLTAVLVFGMVMGFFATLKMADFLGIAETLVKLAEALLSSAVVAVGVVVWILCLAGEDAIAMSKFAELHAEIQAVEEIRGRGSGDG